MKTEKDSISYLIILIISTALTGMILYPLLDFIICKFIINTPFIYSVYSYIMKPTIFACVFGTTFWMIDRNNN